MSNHQPIKITSFTSRYNGLSRELVNEVIVSSRIFHRHESTVDINTIDAHPFKALWDTGATNCVITQKIVNDLNLKPVGMTRVTTAAHIVDAEVFFVSILLPNKMWIPNVRVTKGNIAGHDMLIGMDIIGLGDFAVSHHNGRTTFSFRMPSIDEIDFTQQSGNLHSPIVSSKISRNAPCPCGSGKKYKRCHGQI